MKRLLIFILALVVGAPATSAQGLPRALALTVSVNTNGVVVAPTNFWAANSNSIVALTGGGGGGGGGGLTYGFSTNAFSVTSGTNVALALNQSLAGHTVIDGGLPTWDYTVQDVATLSMEGNTAELTGLQTLIVDGQRELTIFARTNFHLWTPQAWAMTSATNRLLALRDTETARAEYIGVEQANLTSGANLLNVLLIGWTASGSYTLTSASRDSDGVITSASISWPDGSAGTFNTVTKNTTFLTIDAFTISHAASGRTVTQGLITRDGNGLIIAQPALTVTP